MLKGIVEVFLITVRSHLVTLKMTSHFCISSLSILARSTRSSHKSETVSSYKEPIL